MHKPESVLENKTHKVLMKPEVDSNKDGVYLDFIFMHTLSPYFGGRTSDVSSITSFDRILDADFQGRQEDWPGRFFLLRSQQPNLIFCSTKFN